VVLRGARDVGLFPGVEPVVDGALPVRSAGVVLAVADVLEAPADAACGGDGAGGGAGGERVVRVKRRPARRVSCTVPGRGGSMKRAILVAAAMCAAAFGQEFEAADVHTSPPETSDTS